MPKEYHRGKPPPPSPPSTPPIRRKPNRSCIGWMVGGVALGVLGSSLLSPQPNVVETAKSAQAGEPVTKPTFTYEKILSETEVDISKGPPPPPPAPRPVPVPDIPAADNELATLTASESVTEPAPAAAALPPAMEPSSGTYVVQIASFSRTSDAERLQAQLNQLGVPTGIQTATLANGKTVYRVRTGAYASRPEAEQVRALLKRQGQDGMTIPVK